MELLPPMRQTIWGPPAVANFFLGGMGSGAYVLAAALSGLALTPLLSVARVVAPLLVIAGFLAVAAEAGRPWRGFYVLRMVQRSWMSRELWAGLAFALLASADVVWPVATLRLLALLAALLFVVSQGFVVYRARGVAAWNVPLMPPLFLTSGFLTGAGLLGIFHAVPELTRGNPDLLVWTTLGLIMLNGVVWVGLLGWAEALDCREAMAVLKSQSALARILGVGHLLPLLLLAGLGVPALPLAGLLLVIGGGLPKALLILQAGQFRPIAIAVGHGRRGP